MGPVFEAGFAWFIDDGYRMVEFRTGDIFVWSNGRDSASSQCRVVSDFGARVHGELCV